MNRLKTIAKRAMGKALLQTGVWEKCLRRWARRGEAIVLTYHRVIEKWDRALDYSQPGMVVTADTFNHQLTFLEKYFDIVPLSFFLNPTPNTQHQKPVCSITFDDGWRDNYEIAFAILRKHSLPATIFLTADFVGTTRAFWHTELNYVLLHGELPQLIRNAWIFHRYPTALQRGLMRLARMMRAPFAQEVDPFIEAVKHACDEETIEELIRDLADILSIRRPVFQERRFFLEWDEVREMAEAGIEIGSHGCSHRLLTRLNADEVEEELVRSKAAIEDHIDQPVQHFAFPDGAWNRDVMALVGKAGYRTACLCGSGPDRGPFGTLAIQRLGVGEAVSVGGDGFFSDAALLSWMVRAPRIRPA